MKGMIKRTSKEASSLRVWRQQPAESRKIGSVFVAERRIWTVSSSSR